MPRLRDGAGVSRIVRSISHCVDVSNYMKGIQYLTDENGKQTAVLIDLQRYAKLWEDMQDAILSKERLQGSFEPIEALHARLAKKAPSRRLKPLAPNVSS